MGATQGRSWRVGDIGIARGAVNDARSAARGVQRQRERAPSVIPFQRKLASPGHPTPKGRDANAEMRLPSSVRPLERARSDHLARSVHLRLLSLSCMRTVSAAFCHAARRVLLGCRRCLTGSTVSPPGPFTHAYASRVARACPFLNVPVFWGKSMWCFCLPAALLVRTPGYKALRDLLAYDYAAVLSASAALSRVPAMANRLKHPQPNKTTDLQLKSIKLRRPYRSTRRLQRTHPQGEILSV